MNLALVKGNPSSFIGVDVSASAIKMVELSLHPKQQYRLEGYAQVSLPKGAITDGTITELSVVAEAVKKAWRILGTRSKQIAMAMPAAMVISKRVHMPADLSEADLEYQVETEATQYIPFPLEEMHLDFQVLGPVGKKSQEVEVLIVAAKKEKIEDRIAVAEEAGLKVSIMDVDSYATETVFRLLTKQVPNFDKRKTTSMMIDVGAYMTHINVLVGTDSVYTREQAFGGASLTQEIQRRFGLSAEEAGIAMRQSDLPASYPEEVLAPFMQSVASEIVRAISFFTNSTQHANVDHLLLAGGVAALPGLADLVAEKTGVACSVVHPFLHMSLASGIKPTQLALDAPALLVACGLAMRGVDA